MTTFSTLSLGINIIIKTYIQFTGISEEKEKKIYEYLQKRREVNWIAKTLGDYDLFIGFMAKDFNEYVAFKTEFFRMFGTYIKDYDISMLQKAHTLKRSYLIGKTAELFSYAKIHNKTGVKLTEIDMKILTNLANNSRIGVLQLSKMLKIDVKTAMAKIKNFERAGVIQGYRININRQKLGLKYFKVFIKLRIFEDEPLKKLHSYLISQKYLIHLIENVGKYELEMEIEMPSSEMLQELVRKIRNSFPEEIDRINSTEIIEELKLTWLPRE